MTVARFSTRADSPRSEHRVSPKPAKKRKRTRKPFVPGQRIVWGTSAGLTGFLDRGGVRFAVVIQHVVPQWVALGLVTRMPSFGSNDSQMLSEVLSHHAHEQLGAFGELDGEGGALEVCRRFLLEAPVPLALCSCEDVGFTPSGPDP